MRFASIDIETTGTDPQRHEILSIGCVIGDTGHAPIYQLPQKEWLIDFGDTLIGQMPALRMNAGLIQRIERAVKASTYEKTGEWKHPVADAIGYLCAFIKEHAPLSFDHVAKDQVGTKGKHAPKPGKLTPAGKNVASFDLPFLRRAWPSSELSDCLHRRSLDTGNLYLETGDEVIPDTEECIRRMLRDVPELQHPNTGGLLQPHNAVDDAMLNVMLIRHKLGGSLRLKP